MQQRTMGIDKILFFCVAFIFSVFQAAGQINQSTISGNLLIKVARNATIDAHNDPMDFGWVVGGQIKTLLATDPAALRFRISGEGTATMDVTFPKDLTLVRLIGNVPQPGPLNEIAFARGNVITNTIINQGTAVVFVTYPTETANASLPGPVGGFLPAQRWFWLGGTITVPAGGNPGYYAGSYIVTISNYQI